jgi:hypothetical protein
MICVFFVTTITPAQGALVFVVLQSTVFDGWLNVGFDEHKSIFVFRVHSTQMCLCHI